MDLMDDRCTKHSGGRIDESGSLLEEGDGSERSVSGINSSRCNNCGSDGRFLRGWLSQRAQVVKSGVGGRRSGGDGSVERQLKRHKENE